MTEFIAEVELCIPSLRRYARVLTRGSDGADDLVQDCLERGLGRRHLWRRRGSVRAWLFTIMHNIHANDTRRWAGRPRLVPIEETEAALSHPAKQHDRLVLRDVETALGRLPEEQRQVLLLVALEGFSYREVAAVLRIPAGTVMSRLSRAREALSAMVEGDSRPKLRRVR